MIRIYFTFIILLSTTYTIKAQTMIIDSVSTIKIWQDNNGENKLQIHVSAASNIYDNNFVYAFDGHPTAITATLSNKKYHLTETYDHKPYELEMLLFFDEAIWFYELNGVHAIFIPVFNWAMLDLEIRFSYIILYNNKKYLYHFEYNCQEEDDNATCTIGLKDKDLRKKLRKMPLQLRDVFINYLQTVYTTRYDLAPNHTTFRNSKYKLENQPVVLTDYQANYPYILLDKVYNLLEQQSYQEASKFMKQFEEGRYQEGNETYITQEEEKYKILDTINLDTETIIKNKPEYLEKAKKLTFDCRYKEAYQIYKIILDNHAK